MTRKNAADRRSEELRVRKRSAVNRHMNRFHADHAPRGQFWTEAMKGMTTVERVNLHYDQHELWEQNHKHEDLESWEEMEGMNGAAGEGK